MSITDPICQGELESLLEDTFLQSVFHYDETDSTNTRAIELLASGDSMKSPCLIYAESQIAGRGRGANRWWSASGSLTFSLVVEFPNKALSAERKALLPLLTGKAILRTGESLLPNADFALKWPNDVYLAGRKLAGVLIEVPSHSAGQAVIDIQANANH
ncbi:MAG: biotin--[acetyl-CoA-carboxylase] ligase, partial [Lacipirellulaceae bacterium]